MCTSFVHCWSNFAQELCTEHKNRASAYDQNLRVASLCGYKGKERAISKSRAPMQLVQEEAG